LTRAGLVSNLKAMEVNLLDSQEAQLNELAARTGRGTDELVQEAVAKLLAQTERFREQVQVGVDQIARGEFIEEEEMDERVERMLQSEVHPMGARRR
jgi:predicted transcriptional regulator